MMLEVKRLTICNFLYPGMYTSCPTSQVLVAIENRLQKALIFVYIKYIQAPFIANEL